jgi:hypothetical protein
VFYSSGGAILAILASFIPCEYAVVGLFSQLVCGAFALLCIFGLFGKRLRVWVEATLAAFIPDLIGQLLSGLLLSCASSVFSTNVNGFGWYIKYASNQN